MFPNDPFHRFDLDCLRLVAIQVWASTVQRTSNIDVDIVDLARGEACRRYNDLEDRLTCVILLAFEEVRDAIETWATWQALELQVSRQNGMIGPDGIHDFIQNLEQTLERLTTHPSEDQFLL